MAKLINKGVTLYTAGGSGHLLDAQCLVLLKHAAPRTCAVVPVQLLMHENA